MPNALHYSGGDVMAGLQIIKPMSLGILQKPYQFKQQNYLAVTALAFFRLGQSDQTGGEPDNSQHNVGQRMLPEHSQWQAVTKSLPAGEVLDMAMPKPHGEVLLAGSAYTPGGKLRKTLSVSLRLSRDQQPLVDKTLHISGDRQWYYSVLPLLNITPATPFTHMPLHYNRAFGGERYAQNPLGQGYTNSYLPWLYGDNRGAMPNIYYPDDNPSPGRARIRPAGFGAIDITWPPRSGKAGTYNQVWADNDFPGYARDMDWSIFNAAAADQQIDGFFQGGETYQLQGLHPKEPTMSGQLPSIRARAFIKTTRIPFREVTLNADTVYFFPGDKLGVMLFHGAESIDDSDALDVEAIMLAYEGRHAKTRQHYRRVMDLRLNPKTAVVHVFNESQLCPEKPATAMLETAEAEQQAEQQALLDETLNDFWAQAAMPKPADYQAPKPPVSPLPTFSREAIAEGDLDLSALLAAADKAVDDAGRQGQAQRAQLQAALSEMAGERAIPPAETALNTEAALQKVNPEKALQDTLQTFQASPGIDAAQQRQISDSLHAAQCQQQQAHALSNKPLSPAVSPAAAEALGRLAARHAASRTSMQGLCFSGARIEGIDFSGLSMQGVLLERTQLSHCNFSNAALNDASFAGAHITGCVFREAGLHGSNWSTARLENVAMQYCVLTQSRWHDAQLTAVDFDTSQLQQLISNGSRYTDCQFSRCTLDNSAWVKGSFTHSDWRAVQGRLVSFLECRFQQGCFDQAVLNECAFLNLQAGIISFRDTRLHKVLLGGECVLTQADFTAASARECGWRCAQLPGADFTQAQLRDCDLGKAKLAGAVFTDALLYRCLLMQASAPAADFSGSDWYQSLARKADLRRANLTDCQIHSVELGGVDWADTCIDGCEPQPGKSKTGTPRQQASGRRAA